MTSPRFGRREWFPRPITGWFALSNDLIRRAVLSAEELVRAEIRRVIGEQEEQDFMTGSGQPGISLGVFTASAQGISTSRDFSTGNTTTEIKIKGLKAAKHGLKRGYHPFASWLFHSDAVEQIDQITDGNGRPIWNENIRDADGNPRLLGFPVEVSDFVPNTFTTGLYVGMLGDFRQYLIAESLVLEIKRLNELKALNNLTVFLVRTEVDGMPKLEEAFSRVKLA
jgi:HK97 family phage major capsid protein